MSRATLQHDARIRMILIVPHNLHEREALHGRYMWLPHSHRPPDPPVALAPAPDNRDHMAHQHGAARHDRKWCPDRACEPSVQSGFLRGYSPSPPRHMRVCHHPLLPTIISHSLLAKSTSMRVPRHFSTKTKEKKSLKYSF